MEKDSARENTVQPGKDSERQLRLRLCVLNELLNTERDYVRTLSFLQSVSLLLVLLLLRLLYLQEHAAGPG